MLSRVRSAVTTRERTWIRASEAETIVRAMNLRWFEAKADVDRNEAERVVDI
jgi:hypothetical protein